MNNLILGLLLIFSSPLFADTLAFTDSHQRVLTFADIHRFLAAKLQWQGYFAGNSINCENLSMEVASITGVISPQTGKPVSEKPEGDYFKWYQSCLRDYLRRVSDGLNLIRHLELRGTSGQRFTDDTLKAAVHDYEIYMQDFFGRKFVMDRVQASKPYELEITIYKHKYKLVNSRLEISMNIIDWNALSQQSRSAVIDHFLTRYVGVDLALRELRYIGPNSIFPGRPQSRAQLISQLLNFAGQPKRMSLMEAFQYYSYIILSNPLLLEN